MKRPTRPIVKLRKSYFMKQVKQVRVVQIPNIIIVSLPHLVFFIPIALATLLNFTFILSSNLLT